MTLVLPAMSAAIVCNGKELETYDVKQEGTSSLTAFIASEAGQQFKITFSNELTSCTVAIYLYIDGRQLQSMCLRPEQSGEFLGPYETECSILPFKFQELQLVDPDLEDAPVAPEMGTIVLKAFRCQLRGPSELSNRFAYEALHLGRISERSKKAGWHHVATGDEVLARRQSTVKVEYLDPLTGPYASIKIFYRPRELLRAQGIIPANDVSRQGSPINNKRARDLEGPSPGPSRSRPKVKGEGLSDEKRAQRIQDLQAELIVLRDADRSNTSVKRELRSPSPIVVKHPGEVVDLTLED